MGSPGRGISGCVRSGSAGVLHPAELFYGDGEHGSCEHGHDHRGMCVRVYAGRHGIWCLQVRTGQRSKAARATKFSADTVVNTVGACTVLGNFKTGHCSRCRFSRS
jgi:hypothetical protein